jgi:hypothetical protein
MLRSATAGTRKAYATEKGTRDVTSRVSTERLPAVGCTRTSQFNTRQTHDALGLTKRDRPSERGWDGLVCQREEQPEPRQGHF